MRYFLVRLFNYVGKGGYSLIELWMFWVDLVFFDVVF